MIKIAVDPYKQVAWRGVTVNQRTEEMLCITELRSLTDLTPLRIPQGSYSTGVSQSGGTHAGGGALDISVRDMTAKQKDTVVWALRKTGFAAWHRLPSQGDWVEHIHAIAIGDKEMSGQAAWQVSEYRAGRNGLVSQGADDGPRFDPIPVYRQAIDMSFYGPEKWDDADFDRFRRKTGWLEDVSNLNTDPVTTIDAKQSLAWTHQHATDADAQATAARKAAESADKKLDKVLEAVITPPIPPV